MSKNTEAVADSTVEAPAKPKRSRRKKGDDVPIATEKHEVIRTWVAQVPVVAPAPAPTESEIAFEDEEAELIEGDEEENEGEQTPEEEVERYFDKLRRESATFTAVVYRLPYYYANHKTDSQSGRIHCGTIPFEPATFEEEIRQRWFDPNKVNAFYAEVRKNKAYYQALPVILLESPADAAPVTNHAAPIANPSPMPQPAAAAPQVDTFEQQLASFERFMGLASKLQRLSNPAPAPAAAPAIESKEAAIISFLMDGEETAEKLRQSALGKILGGESVTKPHEPSALEVVTLVIQNLPTIVAEGVRLFERVRQSAPPVAGVAPVAAPAMPAPNAAPDPMVEYQRLFDSLLTQLEQNGNTHNAAILIRAFTIQHPQFDQPLMDFLQADNETILAMLPQIPNKAHLAELPHAAAWLTALRGEFFESEDTRHDQSANNAA